MKITILVLALLFSFTTFQLSVHAKGYDNPRPRENRVRKQNRDQMMEEFKNMEPEERRDMKRRMRKGKRMRKGSRKMTKALRNRSERLRRQQMGNSQNPNN